MTSRPAPPSLLLLGLLTAVSAFAIDSYLPALPQVADDLGTSAAGAQLTITALLVGFGAGQLVGGSWSDAAGRRRPLLVGLAAYVVASVLCAVAPSIELLVGLRFAQGVAASFAVVCTRAVVRDCFSGADAARAFARLMLVLGAAPVLAPLVGSAVLEVTSWRGVFAGLALLGGVLLLLSWRRLGETLPPERRRPGGWRDTRRSYGVLLRDGEYVLVALAGALGSGCLFVYIGSSSFVLQDDHGLSPTGFSVVFAVNGLGFVACSQLGAHLVARTGARALLLTGALVQCAGAVVLLVGEAADAGLVSVLVGFFLVVTGFGLVPANATALALAGHPDRAGAASALMGLLSYLVAGLGAPLVSALGGPHATSAGAVMGGCALGCLVLGLASHLQARQVDDAETALA